MLRCKGGEGEGRGGGGGGGRGGGKAKDGVGYEGVRWWLDGRIVNANMVDYLVPVNADVPALDVTFLPGEDMIADPLGVKGLGELVIVGVPAAIANAVFNATGRRITDLLITVEKLL